MPSDGNLGPFLRREAIFAARKRPIVRARARSPLRLAHSKLAILLRGKLPPEDLEAQCDLLEPGAACAGQRALPDAQRILLHFGIAQVLDALGDYAGAAEHLERANALQLAESSRTGKLSDPKEFELLVDGMIAVCGPDFFARVRGFGSESEVPVFVFGVPRSGTTLVEQILAGTLRSSPRERSNWRATP